MSADSMIALLVTMGWVVAIIVFCVICWVIIGLLAESTLAKDVALAVAMIILVCVIPLIVFYTFLATHLLMGH
jgi:hypothetical protein